MQTLSATIVNSDLAEERTEAGGLLHVEYLAAHPTGYRPVADKPGAAEILARRMPAATYGLPRGNGSSTVRQNPQIS
jgi:hypothetical protein